MKRFLFILMWLLPVVYRHALAHTPVYRYYRPDEYCTFRVWGKNMKGEAPFQLSMDLEKQQMDNCRSWAEITSPSIPLAAIREVVYHWSFEQLKQLDQDVVSGKKRTERNAFAQWLIRHKDTEVTAFLMLAKRCETVRQSQNTAWYYPVEGDAVEWELEEIIRQAGAYRGKRLYDRYTLQMLRAYIANRRYTECLNLWLERKNVFREGVIQEMAKGYAAGAYCHIGEIGTAEDMFFEIEDISSYLYCLNKRKAKLSSWDIFYYLCNKNPNGDKVFPCLQYLVHKEETRSKEDSRIAFEALISFLSTEFKERQPDNRAAWYYTLSYAYDRIDIPEKAWKYIRLAEQYNPDPDLREAIRVFRIYLNVKHAQKYDIEFENELYRELVWLDNKIVSCLDSVTRNTIIESGIDIPNANTLIVLDADRFGLAQLYQIRGRVGRSNKIAYAYLMYQENKVLNEASVKRLNVLKEFTELGSGYAIANRDLTIRGAGDILGSEQAGFIDTVGIDLYLKILNDEIKRLKGETVIEDEIKDEKPLINVSTHIDDKYVTDNDLKIEIHKMINTIDSYEKLLSVKAEFEDRFGPSSEDILVYMYQEWFEKLAKKVGIEEVKQNPKEIELIYSMEASKNINSQELFMKAYKISPNFKFSYHSLRVHVTLTLNKLERHPIYYLIDLINDENINKNI